MPADPSPGARGSAVLLVTVLLVLSAAPQGLAGHSAAQPAADCTVLLVRSGSESGVSTLSRVDLPSATTTDLPALPQRIDALGYAQSQALTYGVARSGAAVTVDRDGELTDLGAIRLGDPPVRWDGLGGATAGTVAGDRWYIRKNGFLYTVDISPRSRTYLRVLRATALAPPELSAVGDFAVHPHDGFLHGVSVSGKGDVTAVRIGIGTGRITPNRSVQPPGADAFGSIAFGPDGAGYLLADRSSGAGTLYLLPAGGSDVITEIAAAPPSSISDMAGCLGPPRPPVPPAPVPPSPTAPPPPAAPTSEPEPGPVPTASTTAPAAPSAVPPPDSVPAPTAPPASVAPPMKPPSDWSEKKEPYAAADNGATEKKRRWALTVLLLVVGGAAVVRAAGRTR